MLIYSMSVSVDGFIADREGAFAWTAPEEEQFRFHIAQVRDLGGYLCGRRLYETMLLWETDPSMRDNELGAAFADAWCAIPKVVFSRTLDSVQGNARLAEASVTEEAAAALAATDKDVSIGGPGLAAAAIELGLVDELRMFRDPVVVGGGTPFLPPVIEDVPLDLIETRTFGSRVIYERSTSAPAMSRTDTAVRVISSAPGRVFAARTASTRLKRALTLLLAAPRGSIVVPSTPLCPGSTPPGRCCRVAAAGYRQDDSERLGRHPARRVASARAGSRLRAPLTMIVAPARLLGPPELRRRRSASPRAVDLCLELLDDNELGMSALRSLARLKSARARAVLEHVADEPTNRGRSDEAQHGVQREALALPSIGKGAEAGNRARSA